MSRAMSAIGVRADIVNVRYWHLADISITRANVRYWG